MKNTLKNIIDEYSVNKIPEGKENEYYTKEQLLEISRRFKAIAINQMILFACLIAILVITVLKYFIEFSRWIEISLSILANVGIIISVIIGAIQYSHIRKFTKETSEDSLDN
ncbi:MAG: hypothetical protein KKH01_10210 [Firmicutes bacterium]|nr:hypothetical protein [Bacillota bacterium]